MSFPKIKIETTVKAPIKKAWAVYTQPEHIEKWNFASDDWLCPRATNDLRVGGKHDARMEAKDGSFGFDFTATYEEVITEKRLTYKMADGRTVTTEFESLGELTRVMTTFDAEEQNSQEMQREGWQAILDNYKKRVESLST